MGVGLTKAELNENTLQITESRLWILKKEKQKIENTEFKNHIRNIVNFGIQKEEKIYFIIQVNLGDNTEKLKDYAQMAKDKGNKLDYWKIFSQMLLGLYQLHKLKLLGRCLTLDTIYIKEQSIIFNQQGYFHQFSPTPESEMNKFATFESDLWLIGSIMLELLTGQNIQKYMNQPDLNLRVLQIMQQLQFNVDKDFQELLKNILQINVHQRIKFTALFQFNQIKQHIPENMYIKIQQFYEQQQLKNLLKQWEYQIKRDFKKKKHFQIYFYKVECDSIKYFYQTYLEILLLNFLFHISLHFPCNNKQQGTINQLIILKMWILSKKLKVMIQTQELPHQFMGALQDQKLAEQMSELKKEQIISHDILFILKDRWVKDEQLPQTMYEMQLYIDQLQFDQPQTLTSRLCVNLLRDSIVRQYRLNELTSMTIEEIFNLELYERI